MQASSAVLAQRRVDVLMSTAVSNGVNVIEGPIAAIEANAINKPVFQQETQDLGVPFFGYYEYTMECKYIYISILHKECSSNTHTHTHTHRQSELAFFCQ